MKVERFPVKSCCGTTSITLKLGSALNKDLLTPLINKGYSENKHFTAAGMLYVENIGLIATGAFGSNTLQIKCKGKDCTEFINAFEELLTTLG